MRAFLLVLVLVSCLPAQAFGQESIDFCGQKVSVTATEIVCNDETVSDVSALSALTNLKMLDLALTNVSDVSDLKSLINLEKLSLTRTQVSDVSALKALTKLENLKIIRTKVSAEQVEALKKALPELFIDGP